MKKSGLLAALLAISTVQAQSTSDWYFDVEVIVFKHQNQDVDENFDPIVSPIDISDANSILLRAVQPDLLNVQQALPDCVEEPTWDIPAAVTEAEHPVATTEDPFWWYSSELSPENIQWDCVEKDQRLNLPRYLPLPDSVPVNPGGINVIRPENFHLLPNSANQLNNVFRQLKRQRNVSPLLHTTWRQKVVFGKQNATPVRLIAGSNYTAQFDYWGNPIAVDEEKPSSEPALRLPYDLSYLRQETNVDVEQTALSNIPLLDKVEKALQSQQKLAVFDKQQDVVKNAFEGSLPDTIWEIDGLFKVYLQYINRVPYLHIDSQLNYRKPEVTLLDESSEPQIQLRAYPFNQLRRVISTQLHYFDHPYFGMIVQIRRYRPPAPESE